MKCILSTKKLTASQQNAFLNANVRLTDYDAIKITFTDFKMPDNLQNAIFTSQNAVRGFLAKHSQSYFDTKLSIFCVGQKTKYLLQKNGYNVTKMSQYASELASFIAKYHKNDVFHFFCGNIRSDEIPSVLKIAQIDFFEVKTYKTELKPMKYDQNWDKILFFSPSGVQSFISQNEFGDAEAICIGTTTASEAGKYTDNVTIANDTTIESVIAKTLEKIKL